MRLEHPNTYVLTDDGQRFAVFYTKVHNRLLRPLMAADQARVPLEVRQALRTLDRAVTNYIDTARNRGMKVGSRFQPLATKDL